MVEEIWQELAKAKYMEWEHESDKHSWELQTLKYVFSVSLGCWRCHSLLPFLFYDCREACETALEERHIREVSKMEGFLDEVSNTHLEQLESLTRVFKIAAEADTPTEVHS